MKSNFYGAYFVYRKKEPVSYRDSNGKVALSYKLTCDDGDEVNDIKVSENVYEAVKRGQAYIFEVAYSEYGGKGDIRLVNIVGELSDDSSDNMSSAVPLLLEKALGLDTANTAGSAKK